MSPTCHPGRNPGRLPPTNLLYLPLNLSTTANGLFQSCITHDIWTFIHDIEKHLKTFLFHLTYPDLIPASLWT